MEFHVVRLPPIYIVLFIPIFLLFVSIKFLIMKPKRSSTPRLPPGPPKLPIIGNLHQLLSGSELPHYRLRDLANLYGPVMHLQMGQVPTVILSSAEATKEFFKQHEHIFLNRPKLISSLAFSNDGKDALFAPYGEYGRKIRKILVHEVLNPAQVKSIRFIREEEALDFAKSIAKDAGSVIDLSKKIPGFNSKVIARVIFGKKSEVKIPEELLGYTHEVMKLLAGFTFADAFPNSSLAQWIGGIRGKAQNLFQTMDSMLDNMINSHRKSATIGLKEADHDHYDFVDVLLEHLDDANSKIPLTFESIKAMIIDVFVAGVETPSLVTEWAMSEILKNPKVLEMAQAEVRRAYNGKGTVDETRIHELKFLQLVIKETLRLHSPGPLLLPRESTERCQLSGYELPVGTRVIINVWAIGRDPKYWKDPETFDPDRFTDSSIDFKGNDFEYIPFSSGRRICPGISFGMATIKLTLATLLFHFDWVLPDGQHREDLDMTEKNCVNAARKNGHGLRLIPVLHPCSLIKG